MRNDFAVLIITHGRPQKQYTYKMLKKGNYTGNIYFVVDDKDPTISELQEMYGAENVKIFTKCKKYIIAGDNIKQGQGYDGISSYARNACFDVARKLGLKHFLMLDDDYKNINYRYLSENKLKGKSVDNFDVLFSAMCEWLDSSEKIYAISFGVDGDFIGGVKEWFKRTARNSYFCRCDKPFNFLGRVFEDRTTPVVYNSEGKIFITTLQVHLITVKRQASGGIADFYKKCSSYWQSFYTVMWRPQCCKITGKKEITNSVIEKNAYPKIISEEHKK